MKHEVLLGIDTIEVVIDTQTILNKNNITFYSSNGNEVGKLVHRQGKKKGYNLILNLPRCVRQNNIQPFSVLDADKIYEITTIVVKQLKKGFCYGTSKLSPSSITEWTSKQDTFTI